MQSPVKKKPKFDEEGNKHCLGCDKYLNPEEFARMTRSSQAEPQSVCKKCSINYKWLEYSIGGWAKYVTHPRIVKKKIADDIRKFDILGPPKKSLFGRR